jgi:hypothetical protein
MAGGVGADRAGWIATLPREASGELRGVGLGVAGSGGARRYAAWIATLPLLLCAVIPRGLPGVLAMVEFAVPLPLVHTT